MIKFTKAYKTHEEGEVADLPADDAQLLIEAGYAEEAPAPTEAEEEKALESKLETMLVNKLDKAVSKAKEKFSMPATVKDPLNGMKSKTEFLYHVMKAERFGNRDSITKLRPFVFSEYTQKSTGQTETTNSEGGYTVPELWIKDVYSKEFSDQPNLLGMCRAYSSSGAVVRVPIKADTSRVTRPLQYYNIAEADPMTLSKIAYGQVSLSLIGNKYSVLNWASVEAFNDTESRIGDDVMLEGLKELAFAENDLFVRGAGSTKPTGLLNNPALITVAGDNSQTTTVFYDNMVNMWQHLPAPSQRRAVIIMNQGLSASFYSMMFPNSSGTVAAFGGLTFNAHDEFPWRFFSRPIVWVEQCSAPGNPGDIFMFDPQAIAYFKKPVTVAVSKEYGFANDLIYFKFDLRLDIKGLWNSSVTAYKGSNALSPVVTLGQRTT